MSDQVSLTSTPSCSTCRNWYSFKNENLSVGQCRALPPFIEDRSILTENGPLCRSPITLGTDFCHLYYNKAVDSSSESTASSPTNQSEYQQPQSKSKRRQRDKELKNQNVSE